MSSLKFLLLILLLELLQDVIRTAVLTADTEEGEEYSNSTNRGETLPPLILAHHICAQKADEGPCKGIMPRFYFNIFKQKCEMFQYGGCNGNDNNFETIEQCQEKCVVTEKKWKKGRGWQVPVYCLVEADPGPCRGLFNKYFYNATSRQCEKFMYGGCLGNANNFMTLEDCHNSCASALMLTPKSVPDSERLPLKDVPRPSERIPIQPPSPDKHFFCKTPADPGNCSAKEKRFFYDPSRDRCMPFRYTGCGGNENNFTSRKVCRKVCRAGAGKKKEKPKVLAGKNTLMLTKKSSVVQVEV